jgi:hypothetical protein
MVGEAEREWLATKVGPLSRSEWGSRRLARSVRKGDALRNAEKQDGRETRCETTDYETKDGEQAALRGNSGAVRLVHWQ